MGLVVHLLRGRAGRHAQHGGSDLGGGQEALRRHVKEELRPGVVLAEHRKRPIVRRPRGGADPPGHLPLDHHGDGLEAPSLNEGGDGWGGDVIRQVGAGQRGKSRELLPHQSRNVRL